MGGVVAAELDAVTLDAYGTLVELDDPVGRLRTALAARGIERPVADVERAFATEVRHYAASKCGAASASALTELRRDCADVFVRELGAECDFTRDFADALVFRPLPGVAEALAELRARGLALAVVSNWDIGLAGVLRETGLEVDTVVTCAEAGAAKPDPRAFRIALERLGVKASRALHVGDSDDDRQGADQAGMRFAPAPLAEAVAGWT